MEDIFSFDDEIYQASTETPFDMIYRIRNIFHIIKLFTITSIYLVYELSLKFLKVITFQTSSKNIENQIALVTGAANGLGKETAISLAKKKCKIAIADLNLPDAEKTAEFISKKYKVETKAYKIDVSDYEAVKLLKTEIESTLGPVDILVNNAGIMPIMSIREGRRQDIQKIIDVNLTSHFWMVRTFLDGMIDRKRGHIVGISSLAGKISIPLAACYTATKFGLRGFMSSLFDELCAYNHDDYIKTTTVYPSFINTRKQMTDVLDKTTLFIARMPASYVANKIVDGIVNNKRSVTLPPGCDLLRLMNILPDKTRKFAKTKLNNVDYLKNVLDELRKSD